MIAVAVFAIVLAHLTEAVRTHTEEEYWKAWRDFLAIPASRDRHHMYVNKQEHDIRFEIFKDNLEVVKAHNMKKNVTWKMGVNQFSDMTAGEFRTYSTCITRNQIKDWKSFVPKTQVKVDKTTVPDSVDWVTQGAVTPIKNQ